MPNLLEWLRRLLNPRPPAARPGILPGVPTSPPAGFPPDSPDEPAQILNRRVLLLVYDPVVEPASGRTLSQLQNWYGAGDLVAGFSGDLLKVSRGLARYHISERLELNEFPAKVDGFRYTAKTYLDVLGGAATPHQPQEADYGAVFDEHNILARVASAAIDEIWIIAFPHAGFHESTMGGPGAFWCNSPPLLDTDASRRRFVVMGFSSERKVGEMHEAFGHRFESTMMKAFSKLTGSANLWERFIRYERSAPGLAACGNIHFAPNSERDYDWNNLTPVRSECYDWLLNFPDFAGDVRTVTSSEWGSGDMRAHHTWWLNHVPRVAGRQHGIHNNWWQYVLDPDRVPGWRI